MAITSLAGQDLATSSEIELCKELHDSVMKEANEGLTEKAFGRLSPALSNTASQLERTCAGLVLAKLAAIMSVSGRTLQAEAWASRSIGILQRVYTADSVLLLGPLNTLAIALIDQGKITPARLILRHMQAVKLERPEHTAMLHSTAAALLAATGKLREAESEYLVVVDVLERAGNDRSMEMAAILYSLGALYLREHRFDDVQRVVERAIHICGTVPDALAMDWIRLLGLKATVHIERHEWSDAEQTLRRAISMAEGEARSDPVILATLPDNYADVLRETRRKREARAVDQRIRALLKASGRQSVIDITNIGKAPKRLY